MTEPGDNKEEILKSNGYVYNFDREMYFSRKAKKVFSMDFIEERPTQVIEQCVREANEGSGWQIYFVGELSASVRRQLESSLA